MQQICKKSSSMKRMVYLVACLPFWLTSCEEKVTALHFNEAEQVFEIGKESELRFLNETFEIKDKNMEHKRCSPMQARRFQQMKCGLNW